VAGFRVIHAPGHTPGHIIFFREADRVVLAGDVLANFRLPGRGAALREPPRVFCTDASQNRRSARMLASLHPAVVCFGHGPPLRDLRLLERFVANLGAEGQERPPGASHALPVISPTGPRQG
jgi:glyoxylase-like metal-dependent hydrolase (beta-lactamase superfamily II)